jgi:hypothetical protein
LAGGGEFLLIDREEFRRPWPRDRLGGVFKFAAEIDRWKDLEGDNKRELSGQISDSATASCCCEGSLCGIFINIRTASSYSIEDALELSDSVSEELRPESLRDGRELRTFDDEDSAITRPKLSSSIFVSNLDLTTEGFDRHARNNSFEDSFGIVLSTQGFALLRLNYCYLVDEGKDVCFSPWATSEDERNKIRASGITFHERKWASEDGKGPKTLLFVAS